MNFCTFASQNLDLTPTVLISRITRDEFFEPALSRYEKEREDLHSALTAYENREPSGDLQSCVEKICVCLGGAVIFWQLLGRTTSAVYKRWKIEHKSEPNRLSDLLRFFEQMLISFSLQPITVPHLPTIQKLWDNFPRDANRVLYDNRFLYANRDVCANRVLYAKLGKRLSEASQYHSELYEQLLLLLPEIQDTILDRPQEKPVELAFQKRLELLEHILKICNRTWKKNNLVCGVCWLGVILGSQKMLLEWIAYCTDFQEFLCNLEDLLCTCERKLPLFAKALHRLENFLRKSTEVRKLYWIGGRLFQMQKVWELSEKDEDKHLSSFFTDMQQVSDHSLLLMDKTILEKLQPVIHRVFAIVHSAERTAS